MSLCLKQDFVIPSYRNSLLSKSDPAYEDYHLCHSNFSTKLITEWNFSWQIQATVVFPLISTLMLIQFWSFNDSSLLKGGVLQRGRSLFQSRTYNLYEFSFQLTIDKICNIIVSYISFSNFPWKGKNWHCEKNTKNRPMQCKIHGSIAMSGLIKCECFEVLLPFTVLPWTHSERKSTVWYY